MESILTLIAVSALLAISEGLSLIPRLKSNGMFQLLVNTYKWLEKSSSKAGKKKGKKGG